MCPVFSIEISGPEVPLRRGGAARGLLRALHLDPGPSEDLLELEIRQATLWTQLQLRGGRLNRARFNLGSTLKVEVSLGLTFARCEPSLIFSPVENQAATLQYHRIRRRVVSQVWFEIVLNSFFCCICCWRNDYLIIIQRVVVSAADSASTPLLTVSFITVRSLMQYFFQEWKRNWSEFLSQKFCIKSPDVSTST